MEVFPRAEFFIGDLSATEKVLLSFELQLL